MDILFSKNHEGGSSAEATEDPCHSPKITSPHLTGLYLLHSKSFTRGGLEIDQILPLSNFPISLSQTLENLKTKSNISKAIFFFFYNGGCPSPSSQTNSYRPGGAEEISRGPSGPSMITLFQTLNIRKQIVVVGQLNNPLGFCLT